jgi:hypothetical protein
MLSFTYGIVYPRFLQHMHHIPCPTMSNVYDKGALATHSGDADYGASGIVV